MPQPTLPENGILKGMALLSASCAYHLCTVYTYIGRNLSPASNADDSQICMIKISFSVQTLKDQEIV